MRADAIPLRSAFGARSALELKGDFGEVVIIVVVGEIVFGVQVGGLISSRT